MSTIPSHEGTEEQHPLTEEDLKEKEINRLRDRVNAELTHGMQLPISVFVSRHGISDSATSIVVKECIAAEWEVQVTEQYLKISEPPGLGKKIHREDYDDSKDRQR